MTNNTSLFQKDMMQAALKQSFLKLNPKILFRNPVMFTVEIGTAVMFFVCIWILMGEQSQGSFMYNFIVFLVLLLTLLFANFAEAIAEARGKAQADSLRKTREETPARKISELGKFHTQDIEIIPSSQLKKATCFFAKQEISFPWTVK
jgi:K+-transporting ATPase ATPase B chain